MYTKSAKYYDDIYGFRDYVGGAAAITTMIRENDPGARTLLDVACGTGKHFELWRDDFVVEGLDLSADLLHTARARCPGIPFHETDMIDFELAERFDVVTCLFSAIVYVRTLDNARRSIACMARHLAPNGLLILEPWFTPETFWLRHLVANVVDQPDLKISWMYVGERRGALSLLDINFQIGTPAGISQFRELHEMGLFTNDEYVGAFQASGLHVKHRLDEIFSRGLYIGVKTE